MADGAGSCPSCNRELIGDAPFCHHCGTAITPGPVVMPLAPAPGPPVAPGKLTVVLDDLGDDPALPPAGSGAAGVPAAGSYAPTTPAAAFAAAPGPTGGAPAPTVVSVANPPMGGAPPAPARPTAAPGRPRPTLLAVAIVVVIVLAATAAGAMVLSRDSGGSGEAAGGGSGSDASGGPGGGSNGSAESSGSGESGGDSSESSGSGGDSSGDGGGSTGESGGGSGSGTGGEDAFCAKIDEIWVEAQQQADQAAQIPEDDTFGQLVFLLGAIGDIQVYMDELVDVAPDEIRSDMEQIAESMQPVTSTDPAEIALQLALAMTHVNSFTRVDQYASAHCGRTLFGTTAAT